MTNSDSNGAIFEELLDNMLATMPEMSAKQFVIKDQPFLSGRSFIATLYNHCDGCAVLYGFSYGAYSQIAMTKNKVSGIWGAWRELAIAEPPQAIPLSLLSGWTSTDCWCTRTQDGFVHLHLSMSKTTGEQSTEVQVGTLPAGYRPAQEAGAVGYQKTDGKPVGLRVSSNGAVYLRPIQPTTSFASILCDVHFLAAD